MKLLAAGAGLPVRRTKTRGCWLLLLLAAPLGAGTIDASGAATVLLAPGDSLVFGIPSWNYSTHAAHFGLPLNPTDVSFALVSAVSDGSGMFEAELRSGDGSFSMALGAPLSFAAGVLSSSNYAGPVSTLEASFHLNAHLSQQIFGNSYAELTLRNLGPAVRVGLPPNTLGQDLSVSLSGGSLSVGALHGAVMQATAATVPEPQSAVFLLVGGVLLWLSRIRRKKGPQP